MKEALDGKLGNSDIFARYYSLLFLIAMYKLHSPCLSIFGLWMLNTEPCLSMLLCYACDLYVKKKKNTDNQYVSCQCIVHPHEQYVDDTVPLKGKPPPSRATLIAQRATQKKLQVHWV